VVLALLHLMVTVSINHTVKGPIERAEMMTIIISSLSNGLGNNLRNYFERPASGKWHKI
jgi:hypothetical protein